MRTITTYSKRAPFYNAITTPIHVGFTVQLDFLPQTRLPRCGLQGSLKMAQAEIDGQKFADLLLALPNSLTSVLLLDLDTIRQYNPR